MDKYFSTLKKDQPILEVKHISQIFGKNKKQKIALNDLSLVISKGEHISIMGPNGAGKSTFIDILAGLKKPVKGSIEYHFDDMKNYKNKIGIQFQSSSYPSGISARDVIRFALMLYDVEISHKELNQLIKTFGIDTYLKKRCSTLSGGQVQRLNLLVSLIHKPEILLLDELSTGLDIEIRTNINKFIKEYAASNNITLILVSHNIPEIEALTSRTIFLIQGQKVADLYNEDIIKEFGSIQNLWEQLVAKYHHST